MATPEMSLYWKLLNESIYNVRANPEVKDS
jgi:hypothetical protein